MTIHKNVDDQDQSQQGGSQSQTEGNRSRRSEVRPYPPPGCLLQKCDKFIIYDTNRSLDINTAVFRIIQSIDIFSSLHHIMTPTAVAQPYPQKQMNEQKSFTQLFSEMRSTNKLEKSRQSARECRARKKLRYQVRAIGS